MDGTGLLVFLFLVYVALPVYLYIFCFKVENDKYQIKGEWMSVGVAIALLLGIWARYCTTQSELLLISSTVMLFTWMKLIRLVSLRFDPSVLKYLDHFLLFFVIPSDTRYIH